MNDWQPHEASMHDPELLSQVSALRARGLTPQAIARALGIRPSEAAALVRASAEQTAATAPDPALAGCWVNCSWSRGLSWEGHDDWPGDPSDPDEPPCLVQVLVAREHRGTGLSVCGFLVDPGCLGLKNALGPRVMSDREVAAFVPQFFQACDGGHRQVPLDLARDLVFGAVDYARTLGFEPHRDFAACRGHLGEWTGPSSIRFGYRGKPMFFAGPRDDSHKVINTLQRTVGDGNFDFVVVVPQP